MPPKSLPPDTSSNVASLAPRRAAGDFTTDKRVLALTLMAVVVGTGGAFAAWLLVSLISLVSNIVWFGKFSLVAESLANARPSLWMLVVPVIGGLVIGLMARFGSEKIRGHGIPEAIEAILIGGSRMSPKVAVLKPLSSAISIGTGGPFGAEGPIIMTGGAIGSLFAQCFEMSSAERKSLLVAGAAAGMTAIFGTPIAALLLAVELLLFEWKPRSFIPVAVAVCVSACWRPALFGAGPLFPVQFAMNLPWWGIALCAGLGILTGFGSGLLTVLLYKVEDLFEALPIHWMWCPAIGGLFIGIGGLIEPRALGVGYDIIEDLLHSNVLPAAVLTILAVKVAIWLIALSSGTSGGVLAPLLIFGGAIGWLAGLFLPGDQGFWALIGMAAMMGGTMRAPLTGTFFAVELTGDLSALLPLLAATVSAYAVTVLVLRRSILTEKIARRGQHITREYGIDPFELTRARDIMIVDVDVLSSRQTVGEVKTFFETAEKTHRVYPVVTDQRVLLGMVSRADVLRWQQEGVAPDMSIADATSDADIAYALADDTVGHVTDIMLNSGEGRIPVIDPQTKRLVGLIARKDLLHLRHSFKTSETERRPYLFSNAA
ncbi:chloride channel protein [Rhizobium metallidurans]|uniref:H+/Cl- antiporter ClcA n=1 Tax=Rhizobium metallidurans TaxID=1265931 RepID=A0A7W6CPJ1_9HYPH|nr:chloride channel protein [Rhizobium metallidurans]MBB3964830.1 H+/Cl- antiporter ClcA [Rhizobium metallidurans]